MIFLKHVERQWSYANGIITAVFHDGAVIDIPVGSRSGAFYLFRCGEHEWYVAPVRFPHNTRESFDGGGRYYDFLHISGGAHEVHEELASL